MGLKPFTLVQSSELNDDQQTRSRDLQTLYSFSEIFRLFLVFDGQFRLFSFSESNTYLDNT